jgi:hypothetical protein
MVNASLNWASIVGIVLAIGGTLLYFLRTFRPNMARDYDVFFAAVGLLCGGILFFQGWRLDPILQFGQFLLAATTVFFAYEAVRLRAIATEQAKRAAFLDDEEPDYRRSPRGSFGGYQAELDDDYRFEDRAASGRRIRGRDYDDFDEGLDDRPRRSARREPPSLEDRRPVRRRSDMAPNSGWEDFEEETERRSLRPSRRSDDWGTEPATPYPDEPTPKSPRSGGGWDRFDEPPAAPPPEPPAERRSSPRRLTGSATSMPRSRRDRQRGLDLGQPPADSGAAADTASSRSTPGRSTSEPYVDYKPLPPLGNLEEDNSSQFDD